MVEQKEEFILLWKTGKYTITSLVDMFSIRPTVHEYIERYKKRYLKINNFPGRKKKIIRKPSPVK